MFAHNGTIFGFKKLKERILNEILPEFQRVLFGTTDSEHLFFFLLSEIVRMGCSPDGRCEASIEVLVDAQERALSKIFQWAKELGVEPPKANYILTNGSKLFARRAGLELYLATQKRTCADALTCPEANKICLEGIMPKLREERERRCNHLLISSEPIGEDNIWEEIPEGALVALSTDFRLSVHKKPEPFWVTWPPEVTRHSPRTDVIRANS
jgi:glutamine amidotransferase